MTRNSPLLFSLTPFLCDYLKLLAYKFALVAEELHEVGRVDNLDILGKSYHETTNTSIVADHSVEQPVLVVSLCQVALGKWVLLDKEVVRHNAEQELYGHLLETHIAEDVAIGSTNRSRFEPVCDDE